MLRRRSSILSPLHQNYLSAKLAASSVAAGPCSNKFYGPYKIIRKVGEVAYELEFPENSKVHNVFHVSCLKKKLGPTNHIQIELPLVDIEGRLVLEIECILEVKTIMLCSRSVKEYLVKWKNLQEDEFTWENGYFL